jgi:hypothetical protein
MVGEIESLPPLQGTFGGVTLDFEDPDLLLPAGGEFSIGA